MKEADLDLYTDYLLSTFGAATATGLSAMVEGDVSHDQITRFLSAQEYTSKVKSTASLAKSPTRTLRTQSNHVFRAIYATFKLECLSIPHKLNPFALCRKLLINASRSA